MGLAVVNLNELLSGVGKTYVVSLDTEGGPQTLSQISLVNGKGHTALNTYVIDGKLKGTVKETWDSVFIEGRLLIGYNISADLKALQSVALSIPANIVIVDLYYTYMHLLENKQVKQAKGGNTLEEVARVFGISNVCGYHNSLVDATITMRLFWKMQERSRGQFVVLKGKGKSVADVLEEIAEMTEERNNLSEEDTVGVMVPVALEPQKKEEEMELPQFEYEETKEEQINKISKHLFEAVIEADGKRELVRLTDKEYKLLNKIREYTPYYPLAVFYRTVVEPGTKRRTEISVEKAKEESHKKEKTKKEASEEVIEEAEKSLGALV